MRPNKKKICLYSFETLLFAFIGVFLIYPLVLAVTAGLKYDGHFSFYWLGRLFSNQIIIEQLVNSILLAAVTTVVVIIMTLPMAMLSARFSFLGQNVFSSLALMPLILPPFVGALSIKRFLGQFGILNLLLQKIGILDASEIPPDWLGSGFIVVAVLQALHLFPILYLNLTAGLANLDPSYLNASRNLGASGFTTFRKITLPLLMPHMFAGCSIVFIWAFTDIGTPLIVGYEDLASVRIFKELQLMSVSGRTYSLVLVMLLLSVFFYCMGKVFFGKSQAMDSVKASVAYSRKQLGVFGTLGAWAFFGVIIFVSVLPHIGVVFSAFSSEWIKSIFPSGYTTKHLVFAVTQPDTRQCILNSFTYALLSTTIDIIFGGLAAWLIVREKLKGAHLLDILLMLPLAVPGVILAAGYIAMSVTGSMFEAIGPMNNPLVIIVIAYSVRRIPFVVRGVSAGLGQIPESLENAARNLGASFWVVVRKITIPLLTANIIAAGLLTFSFAMLEVSDSLVLAQLRPDYPITKEIYTQASSANLDANNIAAALGVVGMIILGGSLGGAALLMGKRLGAIFRA